MYNILNSISSVNLYTELATVIRLAVVVGFFKSGIQMCIIVIIIIIISYRGGSGYQTIYVGNFSYAQHEVLFLHAQHDCKPASQ